MILWQVLTVSPLPWAGLAVRDVWTRVQGGERPPVPPGDAASAPEGYAALMRELWHHDPVARPVFAEALSRLRRMARQAGR